MTVGNSMSFRCAYLLPIRRVSVNHEEAAAFARYFESLQRVGCEVLVVDGSSVEVFAEHERAWRGVCRHVTVDPVYTYLNGKVNGVRTGVDLASCERIVVADDDILILPRHLARVRLLDRCEMFRPQNYLWPRPWWARMEAARM